MNCLKGGIGNLAISEDEYSEDYKLFDPVSRNVAVTAGHIYQLKPTNPDIASDGPYEFQLPVIDNQYIDLSKTRLYIEGKVVKNDGEDLAADTDISTVNLFTPSLFNSLHVTSNNNNIHELTDDLLHYKTFLETSLSYGQDAINSHLSASHFCNDTPGKYDANNGTNLGYATRKNIIKESKTFAGYFPLNSDFLSNDKYLPSIGQLGIRLGRSPDEFVLQGPAADTSKIIISKLSLYVKYVELHPKIHESIAKQLVTKPMILPFVRTEVKHVVMLAGSTELQIDNLFVNKLPKTVIVGFVDSKAVSGSKELNPYNFQHLNTIFAEMKFNGKSVPQHAYTPDMEKGLCIREFREFFDQTGISHDNIGNSLNIKRFKGGQFLLAFNKNPDSCYHYHIHPSEGGKADLLVKFKAGTAKSYTAIIFSTYDCALTIDSKRELKISYL